MPFVTETTKIFLILPIYSDEQSIAIRFLRRINKTLLDKETREKFELLLTHIVTTKQEYAQTQKWFEHIRHEVDLIRHLRTQLTVTYHTILLPSSITRYTHSTYILDFFETKLRTNSLVFLTNSYVDIESDFLNRCRLNVIENVQIFVPIAFYQYHPHIIARTHHFTDNSTIDLHKSHGWFNSYAFDHIGLYMNDYINLKKSISLYNISSLSSKNLYDLFVDLTDLHILRAPDQSLRVHYKPIKCDSIKQSNSIEYNRCLSQKEKGLASRSQLAMIIIDNEQTNKTIKKKK